MLGQTYYQKNREKILQQQKKYKKEYYQKNREKLLQQKKKYQKKNKEKIKQYKKEYHQKQCQKQTSQIILDNKIKAEQNNDKDSLFLDNEILKKLGFKKCK